MYQGNKKWKIKTLKEMMLPLFYSVCMFCLFVGVFVRLFVCHRCTHFIVWYRRLIIWHRYICDYLKILLLTFFFFWGFFRSYFPVLLFSLFQDYGSTYHENQYAKLNRTTRIYYAYGIYFFILWRHKFQNCRQCFSSNILIAY